jgi:prepilin-type N-terminal cleavage/methylation domain-containing protein
MKRGFTLVELVIVIAILAILIMTMIGVLNPIALVNRAYDAQRKKDLGRLKISFEEYYNDKGCYPPQNLIDSMTCNGGGFSPWMASWPCDPNGTKYRVIVDTNSCPHWYKMMANLANRTDKEVPKSWYTWKYPETVRLGDGTVKATEANYGLSSANVSWFDFVLPPECTSRFGECYAMPEAGRCVDRLPLHVTYYDSYIQEDCLPQCLVSCCRDGVVCGW